MNPDTRAGVRFTDSASGNFLIGGTVVAGSGTPAIDAGGLANQVSMVSLAGGATPLITGGQSGTVTGGTATLSGSGFLIPVTVTGAQPNASVEVDLLDGSCTGSTASLPYLATTTVSIGPDGTGTGTIAAAGDPPLPVFEASDASGPLNLVDPWPPGGFLAGSAERSSWTQLRGHRAAGITDPGQRNDTPTHDEDGRDCVRYAERMHRRIVERRTEDNPLARV